MKTATDEMNARNASKLVSLFRAASGNVWASYDGPQVEDGEVEHIGGLTRLGMYTALLDQADLWSE